jgi:hypothetical protein
MKENKQSMLIFKSLKIETKLKGKAFINQKLEKMKKYLIDSTQFTIWIISQTI